MLTKVFLPSICLYNWKKWWVAKIKQCASYEVALYELDYNIKNVFSYWFITTSSLLRENVDALCSLNCSNRTSRTPLIALVFLGTWLGRHSSQLFHWCYNSLEDSLLTNTPHTIHISPFLGSSFPSLHFVPDTFWYKKKKKKQKSFRLMFSLLPQTNLKHRIKCCFLSPLSFSIYFLFRNNIITFE